MVEFTKEELKLLQMLVSTTLAHIKPSSKDVYEPMNRLNLKLKQMMGA